MIAENKIITKGYGKVIISGEHAVVYNRPAVAFAIDLCTELEAKIIKNDINYYNSSDNKNAVIFILENIKGKICISFDEIISTFNVNGTESLTEAKSSKENTTGNNNKFIIADNIMSDQNPTDDHNYINAGNKITINNKINNNSNNSSDIINKLKHHFLQSLTNTFSHVSSLSTTSSMCKTKFKISTFFTQNSLLISLKSSIPIGYCIGSSAAYNVALHKFLCVFLGKICGFSVEEEILMLCNKGEEAFHNGTPSGVDVSCSLYGGVIYFENIRKKKHLKFSSFLTKELKVFLVDSGSSKDTGKLVGGVKEMREKHKEKFDIIIEEITMITEKIGELLTSESYDKNSVQKFLSLIAKNHLLLKELNVSTTKIDEIFNALIQDKFYGKITGAGGGGFMVYFVPNYRTEEFKDKLNKLNARYVKVDIISDLCEIEK